MLRRTDMGNRIGYDYENREGPTRGDLITSAILHECSEEWLAEQLNESLPEVKKMLASIQDQLQGDNETYAEESKSGESGKEIENDHAALIERHKLWGFEAVPLHMSTDLDQDTDW